MLRFARKILGLLVVLSAFGALPLSAQDYGNGLRVFYSGVPYIDVVALDAMNLVATGSYGNIHKSYDGGQTWYMRANGIPPNNSSAPGIDLKNLFFINDTLGFALNMSKIAKTTDGGETWTMITTFSNNNYDLHFTNSSTGFIAYTYGIRKSTDGGASWTNSLYNAGSFNSVTGTSTTLWACGSSLKKSTNNGNSWTTVNIGSPYNLRHIDFYDDSTGWLTDANGDLYKTTDAGNTWNVVSQLPYYYGGKVHIVNKDTLFTIAADTLFRSLDGGINWTAINLPVASHQTPNSIAIDENSGRAVVVGDYGLRAVSTDFGATFSNCQNANGHFMTGSDFIDSHTGWAIGSGVIIHTTDAGLTWSQQATGTWGLQDIFALDAQHAWTVGGSGSGLRTTDGVNWSTMNTSTTENIRAVHFVDSLNGWFCTQYGKVFKSTNGGVSWSQQLYVWSTDFKDVYFTNAQTGFVGGSGSTKVRKTTNGGSSWSASQSGLSIYIVSRFMFTDSLTGYVAGDPSNMFKTTNGGTSWSSSTNPSGLDMLGVDFGSDSVGYAAGSYGALIKTTDAGATWTQVNSGYARHFYNISVHNEDTFWIPTAYGNVLGMSACNYPVLTNLYTSPPTCEGSAFTLSADTIAGVNYEWFGPNGFTATGNSITISSASLDHHGKYYVRASLNGCPGKFVSGSQIINPLPVATLNSSDTLLGCLGDTLTLSVPEQTGATYLWETNGISSGDSTNTLAITQAATYSLEVTNGCGTDQDTLTVQINPAPNYVSLTTPNDVCENTQPIILNVATPQGGFYNGPGFNGQNFDPGIAGSGAHAFTYNYIDSITGCDTTLASTITVLPTPVQPMISGQDTVLICAGDSVTFSTALQPGLRYSWQFNSAPTGDTTETASVKLHGNYQVTVYNDCDTLTSAPVVLMVDSVPPAPQILSADTNQICLGDSVQLSASGQPGHSLQWYHNHQPVGLDTTVLNTSNPGYYTISSVNQCGETPSSDTVSVKHIPAPTVNLSSIAPVCETIPSFTLNLASMPGGTYTGNGVSAGVFDPSVSGIGIHSLSYFYTDTLTGCDTTVFTNITVLALPDTPVVIQGDSASFCLGDSLLLSIAPQSGMSYRWLHNSSPTNDTTNAIYVTSQGVYEVEVYNACDTIISAPSTVIMNFAPVVSFPGLSACVNETPYPLSSAIPSGGVYSGPGVSAGIFNPSTPGPGIHSLNYYYQDSITGCDTTVTSTVTVTGIPGQTFITSGSSSVFCEGDSLLLRVSSGSSTQWYFNSDLLSTTGDTIFVTAPGSYQAAAHNSCDTVFSNTIVITKQSAPEVTLAPFDTVCLNHSSFNLTGGIPTGGVYLGTGVASGMFDPSNAGTGSHAIFYSYTDSITGCDSTAFAILVVDACTGIEETEVLGINIYPNPSTNTIFIEHPLTNAYLQLFDLQGKVVVEKQLTNEKDQIEINTLSNGVYMMLIRSGDLLFREKVVINH